MFDRPALADAELVAALRDRYGFETHGLKFLALGHDANAWTFRALDRSGGTLFVKLRRSIDPSKLAVAAFGSTHGVAEVVAPLPALDAELSVPVGRLVLIAYPFLEARPAAETGLTDAQWVAYGDVVRRLHSTVLPPTLAAAIAHEDFVSTSVDLIARVEATVEAYRGDDPPALDVVRTWAARRNVIHELARRTRRLERALQSRLATDATASAEFVPCHADIHTHNLLVDGVGGLHVVDWDELRLAPRERDLMFVMDCPIGLAPRERETRLFLEGYGSVTIDPVTMAFYRTDWAIQDIVAYAGQALERDTASLESREYAARILRGLFERDDEVDVALRSELGTDTPIIPG